jgi:hypothetical protein
MNLSEVPSAALLKEYRRRQREQPKPTGRPPVPSRCKKCKTLCASYTEARAHCKGKAVPDA